MRGGTPGAAELAGLTAMITVPHRRDPRARSAPEVATARASILALLGGPAGLITQPQEVGKPRADSIPV